MIGTDFSISTHVRKFFRFMHVCRFWPCYSYSRSSNTLTKVFTIIVIYLFSYSLQKPFVNSLKTATWSVPEKNLKKALRFLHLIRVSLQLVNLRAAYLLIINLILDFNLKIVLLIVVPDMVFPHCDHPRRTTQQFVRNMPGRRLSSHCSWERKRKTPFNRTSCGRKSATLRE